MRKIIGSVFLSLDGVMQAPGGPEEDPTARFDHGGWVAPYFDGSLDGPMDALLGGDYELLLGRRTWEIFATYWPHNGEIPVGETFNRVAKHVVTSRPLRYEWANSHVVSGDPAQGIAALKASAGPDLLIQGSGRLYDALLPAGLVDRLALITYPVVLGAGKRLFSGDPAEASAWKMVEHHRGNNGVTFSVFEPDGPVRTGSFEFKPPSVETLDLRERMRAGDW